MNINKELNLNTSIDNDNNNINDISFSNNKIKFQYIKKANEDNKSNINHSIKIYKDIYYTRTKEK